MSRQTGTQWSLYGVAHRSNADAVGELVVRSYLPQALIHCPFSQVAIVMSLIHVQDYCVSQEKGMIPILTSSTHHPSSSSSSSFPVPSLLIHPPSHPLPLLPSSSHRAHWSSCPGPSCVVCKCHQWQHCSSALTTWWSHMAEYRAPKTTVIILATHSRSQTLTSLNSITTLVGLHVTLLA